MTTTTKTSDVCGKVNTAVPAEWASSLCQAVAGHAGGCVFVLKRRHRCKCAQDHCAGCGTCLDTAARPVFLRIIPTCKWCIEEAR